MISDNGASKEGSQNGDIDRSILLNNKSEEETIRYNLSKIDAIGTPEGTEANYPLGWSQAANTPFKYWKQDANAEGGTRNPLIVFYPKGIKDKGTLRTQYGHVNDLLPTTLEFLGITPPEYIRGIKQDTLQGTSLVYSFDDPKAPSRHKVQYYYIFGSRSIYKDGWKAEVYHNTKFFNPLGTKGDTTRDYSKDTWELYNLNEDFNERIDLAKKYPEKLKELQDLFDQQAHINNIYPFVDWDDVFKQRIHKKNGVPPPLTIMPASPKSK